MFLASSGVARHPRNPVEQRFSTTLRHPPARDSRDSTEMQIFLRVVETPPSPGVCWFLVPRCALHPLVILRILL